MAENINFAKNLSFVCCSLQRKNEIHSESHKSLVRNSKQQTANSSFQILSSFKTFKYDADDDDDVDFMRMNKRKLIKILNFIQVKSLHLETNAFFLSFFCAHLSMASLDKEEEKRTD